MSTHNICFHEEISKIISKLSSKLSSSIICSRDHYNSVNYITHSSSSILPLFFPCFMNSENCWARPNQAVFPASPRHIAHTIVDLPVPFGPIITFRWAPVVNSTESYVLKVNKLTNIRLVANKTSSYCLHVSLRIHN